MFLPRGLAALVIIGAAPISVWIISWGTNALLLIMWAIIKTKDLSKSFSNSSNSSEGNPSPLNDDTVEFEEA